MFDFIDIGVLLDAKDTNVLIGLFAIADEKLGYNEVQMQNMPKKLIDFTVPANSVLGVECRAHRVFGAALIGYWSSRIQHGIDSVEDREHLALAFGSFLRDRYKVFSLYLPLCDDIVDILHMNFPFVPSSVIDTAVEEHKSAYKYAVNAAAIPYRLDLFICSHERVELDALPLSEKCAKIVERYGKNVLETMNIDAIANREKSIAYLRGHGLAI